MFRKALESTLSLVYPPLCIECGEGVGEGTTLYCSGCLELLDPIDRSQRCPYCFSHDYCARRRLCAHCIREEPLFQGMAAVYEYQGPPATLVKRIKYGGQPGLAPGAAALMAMYWLDLEWPKPDLIVPVPLPFSRWVGRGFNQSDLLARGLGRIIDVPVARVLARSSGDFSQAGLTRKQRLSLTSGRFYLKKRGTAIGDQTVLLIDDVTTTGTTLRRCAEALLPGCPANLYGLTFCKAI